MTYINMTPHAIVVTNGITYQPSSTIARVVSEYSPIDNGE